MAIKDKPITFDPKVRLRIPLYRPQIEFANVSGTPTLNPNVDGTDPLAFVRNATVTSWQSVRYFRG